MGRCKLCNNERKLIKSHIISKLLFKDLFEYRPRLSILQTDIIKPHKKPKKASDVLYDKHLFCERCDGPRGMGLFEDYFKKYITNPKSIIKHKNGIDWIIYTEYDYDKFFLFFNIQIYRASLSKRNEFKMVELDDETTKKIQFNIKNKKVVEAANEIAIIKFSENSNLKNSIGSFRKINNNYYIILRDFIVFYLFNTNDKQFSNMKGHVIKRQELIVPVIPITIEQEFFKNIIGIK